MVYQTGLKFIKKKKKFLSGTESSHCFLTLFVKGDKSSNKFNSNFGIQITLTRFQSTWQQVKKLTYRSFSLFFGFRKLLVVLNFLVTWLTWLGVFYSCHKIQSIFTWWWNVDKMNPKFKWNEKKKKKKKLGTTQNFEKKTTEIWLYIPPHSSEPRALYAHFVVII